MAEEYRGKPKREDERGEWLDNQNNRMVGALVLICLGVLFLLAQMDVLNLSGNWWAVFIALPALLMLYNAYTGYQREGSLTAEVRKNLSGGIMVGTVAVVAATDMWGRLWPLFLIVPGILLLTGLQRSKSEEGD